MLKFFKSKSPLDKLYLQYEKLLKEAHTLSTKNRTESDKKYAEADAVLTQIEKLKGNA
jgi:hypothetical protein